MSLENGEKRNWKESILAIGHPSAVAMLFLGFSAGLPLLLIFATLSIWLTEAGVQRSAVTFFSWAALGYSFKFVWAPLVDMLPIPVVTRFLGRRRSWLLFSQIMIICAISSMAIVDPVGSDNKLVLMGLAALFLGFSSATQDIVIDAYRIESAVKSMQALLAAMYIAGYRIGMLVAGAGSLYLAAFLGTSKLDYNYGAWRTTYLFMAMMMVIGIITTLVIKEPEGDQHREKHSYEPREYIRILTLFVLVVAAFCSSFFGSSASVGYLKTAVTEQFPLTSNFLKFFIEMGRFGVALGVAAVVAKLLIGLRLVQKEIVYSSYVQPVADFFKRYKKTAILILLVVCTYRISDMVLGVISNLFYLDLGFTKNEIATVTKMFGVWMTLLGGFLGGILMVRYGVIKILFAGALLSSLTNLLFMVLSKTGADVSMLVVVIAADNLSGGVAATAFVAFLSALTNISFTAMQYAIFSSLMILFPKLLGGYSGTIVNAIGYDNFFLFTACIGLPVLLLVYLVRDMAAQN